MNPNNLITHVERYSTHAGEFDIYKQLHHMETPQDRRDRGADRWSMAREVYIYMAVPVGQNKMMYLDTAMDSLWGARAMAHAK